MKSTNEIIQNFYNDKIQTDKRAISLISSVCRNKKMLVFGLGYDSLLWNALTDDILFVENQNHYIKMNNTINSSKIIHYKYENISVEKSFKLSAEEIKEYKIPESLVKNAPYDIIFIDGPSGYVSNHPGRLLPIYWSKHFLSKSGTIILIDDSRRDLETYCINKFFQLESKEHFDFRGGLCKITV